MLLLRGRTARLKTQGHSGRLQRRLRNVNRAGSGRPLRFSRLLLVFNLRNSVYRFKDFSNKIQGFGSRNQLPDGGVGVVHDDAEILQGHVGVLLHHRQAGALARLGTVTVISPLELVRTKLQAQHLSYRELGTCVRAAVAQGGWRSLWLGWGPTALRDVPFSALYWFNYELVKSWLTAFRPKDPTSVGISFVAGGISGTVAAILTLPFDVVKTQRQVALGAVEAVRVTPPRAISTWLLLQRIRAESGTRGLFAGFLPRIVKAAPSCAIMISTYEFGKSFFQRLNREQPLGP